MPPLSYPLALALLTSPGPINDTTPFWHLSHELRQLAFSWEVLDEKELPEFFHTLKNFEANLHETRHWTAKMLDAPPASTGNIFPNHTLLDHTMTFNRAYYRHLQAQHGFMAENDDELATAVIETDKIYRIYDLIRNATDHNLYFIAIRRQMLQTLRNELLGPENFEAGYLPPPIPLFLLKDIH